jgi:hypothetical protein
MKETALRHAGEAEEIVSNIWREVILDEVQLVFPEWMGWLELVCEHDGECVPESTS